MPRGGDRGGRRPTLPEGEARSMRITLRLRPETIMQIADLKQAWDLRSAAEVIERLAAEKVLDRSDAIS